MELLLPYINPNHFANCLASKYLFKKSFGINNQYLSVPEEYGNGVIQLFIRNDIHFFRGKWNFEKPTAFVSNDPVGYNGIIDFRVNKEGQFSSASLCGAKRFEWDISEIDGFRFFLPNLYLDVPLKQLHDRFEKYCTSENMLVLSKQIFDINPKEIYNSMLIESKMLEFIYYWIKFLHFGNIEDQLNVISYQKNRTKIDDAASIISDNLNTSITIKQISRMIGLNEQDLKVNFKKLFGLSIHQYQIKLRMEKAQLLISQTDLPLTEICNLLGYSNRGHFAQLYCRFYGHLPIEDRKIKNQ
ncbi:helix-turn-helix transcriptional regulator [Sphingobacterium hungaricum]|uniref:HTH araC/xylS-type domain-containing protein n=1 Tax=Sphingobacterium hungaricum TaxID=2082723 RepID=A0A928YQC9_9SPHI|nr:AraC family transcriptional regulator [Sphingobacterium hungaricum]MBE8712905.1 hypothetical protein [Sphingobacterium hungaricum]